MKDKKNEVEYRKHTTIGSMNQFVDDLKGVAELLSESDFEDYLEDQIMPPLLEDETVYGTSIWTKADIVRVVQIESVLQEKSLSMENAMYKMNNEAVCWIFEHIYTMQKVLKKYDPDGKGDRYIKRLRRDMDQLQGWINGDMFERIQEYASEINRLRGVKS